MRKSEQENNHFLLLYASQTGQASAIAEEIANSAPEYGLKADLFCLSLTEKRFCIQNRTCVVFIASTTGDGEPPDTAKKFFRRISRRTLEGDYLKSVNYTLLALGDSNYIKFCAFGKSLEKRLQALGAKKFYQTGYADDAVGIETLADPWIEQLWPALRLHLGLQAYNKFSAFPSHCIDSAPKLFADCDVKDFSHPANNCDDCLNHPLLTEYEQESNIRKKYSLNNCTIMNCSIQQDKKGENNDTEFSNSGSCASETISVSFLPSLVKSIDPTSLKFPKLPDPFISLSFFKEEPVDTGSLQVHESQVISAASSFLKAKLVCAKKLTDHISVKTSLELTIGFEDENLSYEPGDSFGFICFNPEDEVTLLLERLGVQHLESTHCKVSLLEAGWSKKSVISHLPQSSTLRYMFTSCCDIRSVPKKILLRIISEYAVSDIDKFCLQVLSNPKGAALYTECVRKPCLSLLDILLAFPSCKPPVERILEYLPRLRPRFYSVASSPLVDNTCFRIVFNVVEIPKGQGRYQTRQGICTGWLNKISQNVFFNADSSEISSKMALLSLKSVPKKITIYKRQNEYFYLPEDISIPIIMIGPGTGVAPFISFLQHREQQMKSSESEENFGESWLFYGCRHKEKDFLYSDELTRLHSCKVLTHLIVSFSRDVPSSQNFFPHYVQDNIKYYAQDLVKVIESGAKIYVCGDAKHMAQDVFQAFIEILQTTKNYSIEEAKAYMKQLENGKHYVQDIWA